VPPPMMPEPEATPKPKPVAAPKASASQPSAAQSSAAARPPAASKASFDAMINDLEAAEQAAYSAAFQSLSGGQATLGPDSQQLRSFVTVHTAITDVELDMELLKIASTSDTFTIDSNNFVLLLQMNPVSESDILEAFMGLSSDGEQITSEECRTGLLNVLQDKLGAELTNERAEKIFDTVMISAGLTVSMEQWMGFCKTAARLVRLAKYAKV